ncbi:MAG: ankyrin repeat domain-containing protein [Luteimonas sp.]
MTRAASIASSARWRAIACSFLVLVVGGACARQDTSLTQGQSTGPSAAALAPDASADDAGGRRADGAHPDATDAQGSPPLQAAILRGDRRAFQALLDAGADPTTAATNGNTAMHVAAMQSDARYLEALLAGGAAVDTPNAKNRETPLFNALEARNDTHIRVLLDAGAAVDATDAFGATLLHKAARINATAWVVRFLEAGTDPTARDRTGNTFQPSFFRARDAVLSTDARRDRETVREWLLARGIPVEDRP